MVSAHLLMSCEIALNYTCYPIAAAASLLLYCILSNAFRPDTSIHWTRARAIGVLGLFLAPRQGATLVPTISRVARSASSSRKQLLGIELRKGRSDARAGGGTSALVNVHIPGGKGATERRRRDGG